MRLQTKLILNIFSVLFISIAIIGLLVFNNSKEVLEHQIEHQLEASSQNVETSIDTFLDGQANKIELIATQSSLSAEELNQMLKLDNSFYDLFVINSSGVVVVSTNPERIGLNRADRDYFVNARDQTHISEVYFALVPKIYSISVSTPFQDGVLVGAMNLDFLNKFALNRIGLGETGENLLAFFDNNNNTVYFTKRLFSNKSVEILSYDEVKGRPIYYALIGEEKLIDNLKDYRGEPVLAFANHIKKANLGLVTKIDIKEANEPVNQLRIFIIFISLVAFVLISLIIYLISRQISNDIEELTSSINKITKGNLDIQLNKSDIFEIKNLTDSLNRILASLKLAILRTGLTKTDLGFEEVVKAKEEAENKFKLIYKSSKDAIMTLEPPTWSFTTGNPATLKLFGLKDEDELRKVTPGDLSPEKQPNGELSSVKAKKMIEKAMKEGSNFFEWTHKKYKGKDFPATVLLSKITEGDKSYLQATVRDISESKKEEEANLLYEETIKNMTEGVYIVGLKDVIIKYANPKFEKMFGYRQGEMTGKNASIVNAPTDKSPKERADEIMAIIRKTGIWHGEVKNIKKDGKTFWSYANVSVFNHPTYGPVLLAVHRDISEEKEANEKSKLFSQISFDAMVAHDNGVLIEANKQFYDMFGYSEKELKNKSVISKIIAPEARETLINNIKDKTSKEYESIGIKKNGVKFPIEIRAKNTIYEGKNIRLGIIRDLSKEKESEEKYRDLFDNASDAIFIHDLAGNFLEVNETAYKRLGYTKQELLKLGPAKIDAPRFAKLVPKRVRELKERGHTIFESAHLTKSGKEIPIELSSKVIEYKGKPAILSIAREIKSRIE